jgi:hypothetical protein
VFGRHLGDAPGVHLKTIRSHPRSHLRSQVGVNWSQLQSPVLGGCVFSRSTNSKSRKYSNASTQFSVLVPSSSAVGCSTRRPSSSAVVQQCVAPVPSPCPRLSFSFQFPGGYVFSCSTARHHRNSVTRRPSSVPVPVLRRFSIIMFDNFKVS